MWTLNRRLYRSALLIPIAFLAISTFSTAAHAVPGAATVGAPVGGGQSATPTYTWAAVPSSTWYYLWVNDSFGNRIKQWYQASAVGCPNGSGTCSITPSTSLGDGQVTTWVQTWNGDGNGPWSAPAISFVGAGSSAPGAAIVETPSGSGQVPTPVYSWDAVPNTTWYRLYVDDATGNRIDQWHEASELSCGGGSGQCSVSPSVALNDGQITTWVQTWNVVGTGPWSNAANGVVSSGGQTGGAPYPASDLVTSATWAPTSSIIRLAQDSDNWPVTWGTDGNLYTAYGDGHGFTPQVPIKLSLGHGKVSGSPPNISGSNTYPTNADFQGQGPYGKKASSLLMVDNVLYMWIRNADNNGNTCQVGRSLNQGTTWEFASWTINELGYCTFLNFGQNYAGALDGYVYTYSHNSPSAYTNADNFVLMRVPKAQILNRGAYEFVSGYSGSTPTWSSQVSQRAAVFTHAGRSLRSGISYNAGLGRYIWWQQNVANGVDARFAQVGFGVYESPTPWGPWKTIYFTDAWDTGPGETAMFPTKWMSANGREMYLVFSGNDQFSVRKLTLTTN